MRYLVCYDLADDRRRDHLAKALLYFGSRLQESVFLADLDEALAQNMSERIRKIIVMGEDVVHVFPLCEGCSKRISVLGGEELPHDRDFYIF